MLECKGRTGTRQKWCHFHHWVYYELTKACSPVGLISLKWIEYRIQYQTSGFDSWSNLNFFMFFFNCLHLLNCENHFHFQYWLHCIIIADTFSVKFWDVKAKQTEFYLEAFSRRSKTVFKNTNCPEAVIIPQATRGSKVKWSLLIRR